MTQIGKYVIGETLGRGGMGTVYLGKDTETSTQVAIKTIHQDNIDIGREMLARFIREGEALRQLNHPNIVNMLDAFEHEDQHYLVMEYVDGGDLEQVLEKNGTMSTDRLVSITLELADALTRAHHLDIIHRDIKPANVLLAADGTPRLTDFGVAHYHQDSKLTQDGAILGTVPYLSPEGCQGKNLDARSDIWSFGVLLFEMLAGELPIAGNNLVDTITAI
ncbi:MAG: serine/threonine protein kinase [Chloroflexota bacterium]